MARDMVAGRSKMACAARNAYGVAVIGVVLGRRRRQRANGVAGSECVVIAARDGAPRGDPCVEMLQFYAQDGGLQFVEPAIPSDLGAHVPPGLAVIAQACEPQS